MLKRVKHDRNEKHLKHLFKDKVIQKIYRRSRSISYNDNVIIKAKNLEYNKFLN